jgi:hypothetical protein
MFYAGDYVLVLRAVLRKLARVETAHLVWLMLWVGVTVIAIRQTLRSLWRKAGRKQIPRSGTATPHRPCTAATTPAHQTIEPLATHATNYSPTPSRPASNNRRRVGWDEESPRVELNALPLPPRAAKTATVHFEEVDRHFERVLTRLASEDPELQQEDDDESSEARRSSSAQARSQEGISAMPF